MSQNLIESLIHSIEQMNHEIRLLLVLGWGYRLRNRSFCNCTKVSLLGMPMGFVLPFSYHLQRMITMKQILIIEDDEDIAEIEQDYLMINNYETTIATDGKMAQTYLKQQEFDLILLDIMLPGIDGFTLLKEIRGSLTIPIIMVTAKDTTLDKIKGLGFGADDYLTKPFDPSELVARVKAHLTRYDRLTKSAESKKVDILQINELTIYTKAWKVKLRDTEIKMANREFELLLFLAKHPNIVFSKEQLFEQILGYDYIGDSATVAVHINRIRQKIELDPSTPHYIKTIWGAGYRFNA